MRKKMQATMAMKKAGRLLLACGIAGVLMGCGQVNSTGNLAQNITMSSAAGQSGEVQDREQESGEATQNSEEKEEGVFGFSYEGIQLVPGEIFDSSARGEYTSVAEVPSCDFDGNDRVYNYGTFELTAYLDGDEERIYSIYFMDPNLPTTEGLCMGNTVENMKSLYGENCETAGDSYTFTKGETVLSVIAQNDVVVSIEYRLNKE